MEPKMKPQLNDIEGPIHYENEQWVVANYGLESCDVFYPIQASRLLEAERNPPLYDWPFQLGEKNWVKFGSFVAAFEFAFKHHQLKAMDPEILSQSISEARQGRRHDGLPI